MAVVSITFFGTRGSIPVCGPEVAEFGGNTTCIAFLRKKITFLFIDLEPENCTLHFALMHTSLHQPNVGEPPNLRCNLMLLKNRRPS